MKKLVFFLSIILISSGLYSQELNSEVKKEKFSNQIGCHAGFTTGVGLSYRIWTPSNFGIQLTALPIKTSWDSYASGGLTLLNSFYSKRFFRSFVYLGNHIIVNDFDNPVYKYNVGAGAGIEIGKYPRLNIMLGYAGYDVTGSFLLLPTIEAGIFFDLNFR